MKKPPDPEPVLSQPILQRSIGPLSPSPEAASVQFLMNSGGNLHMPTVSCKLDGEILMTSIVMVESRYLGVIFGRDDAVQHNSLDYSFGCQFSWAQSKRDCWLMLPLQRIWISNAQGLFLTRLMWMLRTGLRFALNLGSFQVCDLLLYLFFFTISFDVLWSFGDLSLFGYHMDFVLLLATLVVFMAMIWYSALPLPLTAAHGTVGKGSYWDVLQISGFIDCMLVSTIVYTLLPDRGSISWHCAQSMRLSNHGPLIGNLWLLCSLSRDLRTSNPIWPVCGPCLFCYLRLGLHLWLVWFVTQHCYMPGMCLMALVLQRRLLGLWLPWWFLVLFHAVFTAPVHAVSFFLFPPWYVGSDWERVLWMLKLYLLPSLCSAGCPLYYLVVNVQLISYPLCFCAARVYLFHPYFSNLLSCVLSFLLVYSSCLPSRCLRNLPLKGDQQIHNLMLTHVLNSVIGVGFFFFWVLPLDLLSLCLCFLYAQMHVPAHVNSCWQLNTLQTTREEMRWMELHLFRAPSITFGLLLTLPQTQSTPVLRAQLSLISYTDFGLIWIVLYWSSGFWPVVSNCNYSFTRLVSFLWVFVCIDKKLSPCSSFAVKIVEPHCCASGLCIKALAWHRQMPVTTHKGLGQKKL